MKLKNYHFAALDFVFDMNYKPWFLEANSMPAFQLLINIDKKNEVIQSLAKLLGKQNVCFVLSDYKKRNEWMLKIFGRYITSIHSCMDQENKHRRKMLIPSSGHSTKPHSILRYGRLSKSFEKQKILVVNPNCVTTITKNKIKTINILDRNLVNIPETFIVSSNNQLNLILKNHSPLFSKGFVLKPISGQKGKDVHIFFNLKQKVPSFRGKKILQKFVATRKHHKKYWDARVYLVDGKPIIGVIRESFHPVTNVSQGAVPQKMPDKLFKKLLLPSKYIVKCIDAEAEKIRLNKFE